MWCNQENKFAALLSEHVARILGTNNTLHSMLTKNFVISLRATKHAETKKKSEIAFCSPALQFPLNRHHLKND